MPASKVLEFLINFEEYKKQIGKIDFSDMLQIVIDEQIPIDTSILMVDEFQDLTAQMYKIFEMWVPLCKSVLVAADPNQSIYEFWGGCSDYYHLFDAFEIVRPETFRLNEQIKDFSYKILRYAGMVAPETKARKADSNSIYKVRFDSKLPVHDEEFHLIRCNYQAHAIALSLAKDGKIFGGLCRWREDEIEAANGIISTAIPVLNKNICGKRLNFFIFRNHFIYTDFFYLGSVGKVHDYPNYDPFFHR